MGEVRERSGDGGDGPIKPLKTSKKLGSNLIVPGAFMALLATEAYFAPRIATIATKAARVVEKTYVREKEHAEFVVCNDKIDDLVTPGKMAIDEMLARELAMHNIKREEFGLPLIEIDNARVNVCDIKDTGLYDTVGAVDPFGKYIFIDRDMLRDGLNDPNGSEDIINTLRHELGHLGQKRSKIGSWRKEAVADRLAGMDGSLNSHQALDYRMYDLYWAFLVKYAEVKGIDEGTLLRQLYTDSEVPYDINFINSILDDDKLTPKDREILVETFLANKDEKPFESDDALGTFLKEHEEILAELADEINYCLIASVSSSALVSLVSLVTVFMLKKALKSKPEH